MDGPGQGRWCRKAGTPRDLPGCPCDGRWSRGGPRARCRVGAAPRKQPACDSEAVAEQPPVSGASTQRASFRFQSSPVGGSRDPPSGEKVGVRAGGSGLLRSHRTAWGTCPGITEGQGLLLQGQRTNRQMTGSSFGPSARSPGEAGPGAPPRPGRLHSIAHLLSSSVTCVGVCLSVWVAIRPPRRRSHYSARRIVLYDTHLRGFCLVTRIHFILFLSCRPRCSNSFFIRTASSSTSPSDGSTRPRVDRGGAWAQCGARPRPEAARAGGGDGGLAPGPAPHPPLPWVCRPRAPGPESHSQGGGPFTKLLLQQLGCCPEG